MRRVFAAVALLLVVGCAATPPPRAVVFFADQSTTLDENGQALVGVFAANARELPRRTVRVLGFASSDGDDARNRVIAEQRARAVADRLRAEGVAPERISVASRGPVPFEQIPLESRRVEIAIDR